MASFRNFTLQAGERLVRVTACTICGSDLHTLAGRRTAPAPSILGHEAVGIEVATGRRVTWSILACCGECDRCRRGMEQKCERLFKYGHGMHAGAPSGGLSELIVLRPGTLVLEVPEGLADEVVCPANCATATVAACLRVAGPVRGLWRIEGVHNYRPEDLGTALRFLDGAGRRFPFGELVARSFPLAEVNEALAWAAEARPVRVMIRP